MKLKDLGKHERKCQQRTVKCLKPSCGEVVVLKKYNDHLLSKNCGLLASNGKEQELWWLVSKNYFKKNNDPAATKYLDIKEDKEFRIISFKAHDKRFHCCVYYYSEKRCFIFTVFLSEHQEVADEFNYKMIISHDKREISYKSNVHAMEHVPKLRGHIESHYKKSWCLPYETIKEFFSVKNVGKNNKTDWEVKLVMRVEIMKI